MKHWSAKDKRIFYHQLLMLLKSGASIERASVLISSHAQNSQNVELFNSMRKTVEAGHSLSHFMRNNPAAFSDYECNAIEAGENNNNLLEIMEWLADFFEAEHDETRANQAHYIYLGIVFAMLLFLWWIIAFEVIPAFASMFGDMGQCLPAFTQLVINLSEWFTKYFFVLLILLIGAAFLARLAWKRYSIEISRAVTHIPMIGALWMAREVERVSLLLGRAVESGIPLRKAVESSAQLVRHPYLKDALLTASVLLEGGASWTDAFKDIEGFPPSALAFIKLGEKQGEIADALKEVWETRPPASSIWKLGFVVSWAAVFLVVVMVGAIAIAMYLPIFSISSL